MNKRLTPIMGWASWNCFRTNINEEKLKKQADALISTGLAECGYTYLNIDDGFFGGRSDDGNVLFHKERFPNGIKTIADYAHSKGLKAGIYSDGGDCTCAFYFDNEVESGKNVGLYGHEEEDLKLYLEECGFDFIKVDWCGGIRMGLDEREQYSKISEIINKISERTNKSIVYNVCRWQFVGEWVTKIADSWRTGADIQPTFESVLKQIDSIKPLARYCSPGHVNDLDMMQLGNGMLEQDEKTHFAMWCMMSTPLIIGCDLTIINQSTLDILKNKELIAINQDVACRQAVHAQDIYVDDLKYGEIWVKDLENSKSRIKAVALLNRSDITIDATVSLKELGFKGEIKKIRDLCNHEEIKPQDQISVILQPHETIVLKVECEFEFQTFNKYDKNDIVISKPDKITIEQVEILRKQGAVLADVRDGAEYEQGHVEGAINIPYYFLHGLALDLIKDKNTKIIVYCKTGKRSMQAYNDLTYLGYKNIYYLGGVDFRNT